MIIIIVYELIVLSRSGVLSTKALCIQAGKSVWVLYIDATCINYDGNAFDAALLAMVAALRNGDGYGARTQNSG